MVPVIIIMRFGENNVLDQNISISRGKQTWSTLYFFLLFIKTEKVQEHDLYLNQILDHFGLPKNFLE